MGNRKIRYIRAATVTESLRTLLQGQGKYMAARGYEVTLISAKGKNLDRVLDYEKVPHVAINMTRAISPVKDLQALIKFIRLFRKTKPHIVHTHTPKAGLLGLLAGKICGVPVRIHTLAGWRMLNENGMRRRILYWVEKITFACAHEVWPNSYSLYNLLDEIKFKTNTPIRVIGKGSSNGINIKDYSKEAINLEKLEEIKTKLNYNPSYTYLLTVGRMVKEKGIHELVETFVKISESKPNLKLILVGNLEDHIDPINDDVRNHIDNHPNIIFVGYSHFVKYYLHLADLLIHPSHREGFPNVPLQAGAMNCPILCSDIGGNIDIVDHKKTGLLFKVKDADDLYKNLEYALENMEEMQDMSDKLLERVIQNFSREYVQKELYNNYERLLKSKVK